MSAWLDFTMRRHNFFAAPSRTNKGGHHGCTPEQIRIGNTFVVSFLKSRSGLSFLWSWKSAESSPTSAEHKATPKSSEFYATEDSVALRWALESLESVLWSWYGEQHRRWDRGESWRKGILSEFCWSEDCLRGDFFYWGGFGEVYFEGFSFSRERRGTVRPGKKGDFDRVFDGGLLCCYWLFFCCEVGLGAKFLCLFFRSRLLFKFTDVSISSRCYTLVVFFPFLFDFFWWSGDGGWFVLFFFRCCFCCGCCCFRGYVWCSCFCCCCYRCFGWFRCFFFSGNQDPPFFLVIGMGPSFQCCADGCARDCAGGLIVIDGSRLLRVGFC